MGSVEVGMFARCEGWMVLGHQHHEAAMPREHARMHHTQ